LSGKEWPSKRACIGTENEDTAKSQISRKTTMTTQEMHKIGTREKWLAAGLELLNAEKELTRHSHEVAAYVGALRCE
jgi:hypothetical protein